MTFTRKGGGRVLKFVTCLRILLFLNNRSVVHFCGWWGSGVKKLAIFCGRHKWMTPFCKSPYRIEISNVLLVMSYFVIFFEELFSFIDCCMLLVVVLLSFKNTNTNNNTYNN